MEEKELNYREPKLLPLGYSPLAGAGTDCDVGAAATTFCGNGTTIIDDGCAPGNQGASCDGGGDAGKGCGVGSDGFDSG
ncbi:MAG: hypothetical protein HQ564_00180, partial [Candidatus Saganbacteria bacterium]|nr:hypothetical protein [Candidatus Saganbacteria bacterium]